MDLAVTDLNIDDRYAMISEMAKLAAVLESWECLESFKFIDTASIPVIKLVSPSPLNTLL
jgi:DNA polymerase sigma